MEQKKASKNQPKPPQKVQIVLPCTECIVKVELQSVDKKSNACSLNQNMENMIINAEMEQNQQKKEGQLKSLLLRKCLYIGIIISQFSILIPLILIQYFSSKIELTPLLLLLIFSTLLYSLCMASTIKIQNSLHQHILCAVSKHLHPDSQNMGVVGTVLKINEEICKRSNAKTKKVQCPNIQIVQQQCTQQTIKKQAAELPQQTKKTQIVTFETRKKIIIACKIVTAVFEMATASMSLFLDNSKSSKNHQIIIAISILMYIVTVGSSVFAYFFLDFIHGYIESRIEIIGNGVGYSQHRAKTKLSIDKLIQAKKFERRNSLIIQKSQQIQKPKGKGTQLNIQKSDNNSSKLKSQPDKQQLVQTCKELTKRSVLKSRVGKPQGHEIEEQCMSRRKVQINSKKIQYFEYSYISPSHSIQEHNKDAMASKYKYHVQKLTSKQQRIEVEQKILKGKISAREKKVQSEVCLPGRRGQQGQGQGEEYRADYFC